MSNTTPLKPVSLAIGAVFVSSLAGASVANAAENPFAMTELSGGYMVAGTAEGKCGGAKKSAEEGKYGATKASEEGTSGDTGEGQTGTGMHPSKEGKGGEGKCGASKEQKKEME
jgi:uncharacterized low-complexity protein